MLADTDDQMIKLQVIYSTNFTALPAVKRLGEAEIVQMISGRKYF